MKSELIKITLHICALLPLPVTHILGSLLGMTLWLFPGQVREVTKRNIALCLPDYTPARQRQLVRRCLQETGKTILETGALWLRPAPAILQLIRHVDGVEHIENAIAAGRGAILATPHLGAWEAAGLYCAARFNITCLYRPLRMPGLEKLVNQARSRAGGNYVPANGRGIRTLYKTLEEGGAVAMLPDQEPQAGSGVFAPFFGTPALTMVFLSRLTAKSGAPIVFVWCERLPWGRGYALHFRQPPQEIYADDLETSATGINRAVEQCIRECPAQYQWSYKRFRTRPAGENSLY